MMGCMHPIDSEQEMEPNAADEIPECIGIDAAADSGAGDHVLARVDVSGHPVEESPGSRGGHTFTGAGGHVMDNDGQGKLSHGKSRTCVDHCSQ